MGNKRPIVTNLVIFHSLGTLKEELKALLKLDGLKASDEFLEIQSEKLEDLYAEGGAIFEYLDSLPYLCRQFNLKRKSDNRKAINKNRMVDRITIGSRTYTENQLQVLKDKFNQSRDNKLTLDQYIDHLTEKFKRIDINRSIIKQPKKVYELYSESGELLIKSKKKIDLINFICNEKDYKPSRVKGELYRKQNDDEIIVFGYTIK